MKNRTMCLTGLGISALRFLVISIGRLVNARAGWIGLEARIFGKDSIGSSINLRA